MSFRARLGLALVTVALVPLIVLGVGVRREMTARITAQYERRVTTLATVTREELDDETSSIASRLASLADALPGDNRFRLGVLQTAPEERGYVLDYAARAMRVAGLSMLQIQDDAGRIVSSGHFRNDYDRLEPDLPTLLAAAPRGAALVRARTAEGPMLVLARVDSVRLGGRQFTLVGGMAVNESVLRHLARGSEQAVTLDLPDGALSSDSLVAGDRTTNTALVAQLALPYIYGAPGAARTLVFVPLRITHPLGELDALLRGVDRWFIIALALTATAALLAAAWLAARVSQPLRELAALTAHVDLDRPHIEFPVRSDDEIGALARLLGAMTRRLRTSAARLREAERRATVGDLARQVNHDVKNGLAPIRNVLRHLTQVAEEHPDDLARVFAERRHTLESSVAYLDTLARSYARLSPRLDLRPCDPAAIAREIAGTARTAEGTSLTLRLDDVPPVAADPIALRRIIENLVGNALDSLVGARGTVTLATGTAPDGSARITIADSGRGMTREELARAFDDFYTTKPNGTGLGLSIVRRLVADLGGALRIDTAPGDGTTATITLPAHTPASPARGSSAPMPPAPPSSVAPSAAPPPSAPSPPLPPSASPTRPPGSPAHS